jgi:hypothetical protein
MVFDENVVGYVCYVLSVLSLHILFASSQLGLNIHFSDFFSPYTRTLFSEGPSFAYFAGFSVYASVCTQQKKAVSRRLTRRYA